MFAKNIPFLTLLIMLCPSCSSLSAKNHVSSYPLSLVETIKPGTTTKEEVIATLKKPDQIIPLTGKELVHGNEAWLYLNDEKDSTRASIIFDKKSIVSEVNWFPESQDEESDLQRLLSHYSPAKFVKSTIPWTTQHSSPSEHVYSNETLGIKIVSMPNNDFVESIGFEKPKSH